MSISRCHHLFWELHHGISHTREPQFSRFQQTFHKNKVGVFLFDYFILFCFVLTGQQLCPNPTTNLQPYLPAPGVWPGSHRVSLITARIFKLSPEVPNLAQSLARHEKNWNNSIAIWIVFLSPKAGNVLANLN